jgi:N-acyl-D-amino-acid deacylase
MYNPFSGESSRFSRRSLLARTVQFGALAAASWLAGCFRGEGPEEPAAGTGVKPAPAGKVTVTGDPSARLLLKRGFIADGTGKRGYIGDVLINGSRIEAVTASELEFGGRTVDCSGTVIAPGFIDEHSHNDWLLCRTDHAGLLKPFTAQGITTFVTGNCGFGASGFLKDSPFNDMIKKKTGGFLGNDRLVWNTMDEYFTRLRRQGISHNIANLAGHGTSRMSIRGYKPDPMGAGEMASLLRLLEDSMEQGCYGASLGLQYEPGIFATADELTQVARLVKKHDKILTVHLKAYSSLSPTYPLIPFGAPHNILALKEMLDIARKTGVRLQVSHLIFVGTDTWDTCGRALSMIEKAQRDGVDVKFDTYCYHCGTSVINVVLPAWFLGRVPEVFSDKWALVRLEMEFQVIKRLLGFGYEDIQITNALNPELDRYNGMFLGDIADKRGMKQFDNFIDIVKKSGGKARVLNHRYSSLDNVKELMSHPAALYMTDAIPVPDGVQNPGVSGCFPRFLQFAREYRTVSLEEAVHKMTGASAERFRIAKRGLLRQGYAADITVFDWKGVKDNNTDLKTDATPSGIEAVFINGIRVAGRGGVETGAPAGMVL